MIYPKLLILFFFSFFLTSMVCAQIKQDSLLDLANPDPELQFQDNFYEALKHKGIENYTKAIDALVNYNMLYLCLGNIKLNS